MAIDYQQILMEMNRPARRQGGGFKKLAIAAFICLMLGGGVYAVWHFSLVDKAWTKGSELATSVTGRFFGWGAPAAVPGVELDVASANQAPAAQPVQAMAPPAPANNPLRPAASTPVPAPSGPIHIGAEFAAAPSQPVRPAPTAAPAAPQAVPAAPAVRQQPGLRPAATPASAPAPGPGMAPAPVLSDAKAQMKVIDQMLSTNPSEAMRRVEELLQTRLTPEEAAEAGYRRGYAARMLKDEAKAESSWRETIEKYPNQLGGRYSALALAETMYRRYASERPQMSYWDDIQMLYSRVLGADDAYFLPDQVKAKVKANLTNLNDSLFFGSAPTKLARYHKVESGELLGSIAGKYRVDYESIARINGVNPNRIRAGMDLKLVVGDVSIVVRKNAQDPNKTPTVTWYLDGRWVREYKACVGDGNKTPSGTYELISKERDPSWTNPANGQLLPNDHPENILGSRWMAMKGMNTQGLGIHGTTVDDSIPGYTSAGCVRLLNRDAEELFSYARIGAKVTVVE